VSARAIARELGGGLSRSAVLGKAFRLRLPRPKTRLRSPMATNAWSKSGTPRSRSAKADAGSPLRKAFQALGIEPPEEQPGRPDPRLDRPGVNEAFGVPCALLELDDLTCRWPVGAPGDPDFAFCGARSSTGRPYCRAHCLIAYRVEIKASAATPVQQTNRREF
jgi:GcrA cell cycle regulator